MFQTIDADGHVQEPTDAIAEPTPYARTKRIIEQAPATVIIRAGLVDIHRQPSVGYRNWLCNPLTPLEWADYAACIRQLLAVAQVKLAPG